MIYLKEIIKKFDKYIEDKNKRKYKTLQARNQCFKIRYKLLKKHVQQAAK